MQVRSWRQVGSSTKMLRRPLLLLLLLTARFTLPADPAPALGAPPATTKSADGDDESASRAAYIPPWSEMRTLIESSLDAGPRREKNDLLARSDLAPIFESLRKRGWTVSDRESIIAKTLPDGHPLVQQLRTPQGTRFMRKVSGEERIYDRLDRISTVSGGEALIRDLVKLPDGERYARRKQGVAVPNLLDLLPKDSSAQTRTVRDFDKATGKIYTRSQLLQQLEKSHATDSGPGANRVGDTPTGRVSQAGGAAPAGAAGPQTPATKVAK